jgi:uncharacterized membrane protein
MIPDPLHPAVVHFPIVLAVLLPLFAVGAILMIRRGARPARAWLIPFTLAGALSLSGWVALKTGESQEDRVEPVLAESVLHTHEEAAERFLLLSGLVFLVAGIGLLGGTVGRAGRLIATGGSLVVLTSGYAVGKAGGELVYRHGAAQAYVTDQATGAAVQRGEREEER